MSTTKKVMVFSTGQGQGKTVETSATTWSGLQKDLDKAGIKYSGMKAVDGASKNNFEHPDAALPEGNLNLFLFPEKTKSGAKTLPSAGLKPTEVRAKIKEIIATDGEAAKAHFNADKNYTTKGSAVLADLLDSYKTPKGKATKEAAPKAKTSAVAKSAAKKTAAALPEPKKEAKTTGVAKVAKAAAKTTSKGVSLAKAEKVVNQDDVIQTLVSAIRDIKGASGVAKERAVKAVLALGAEQEATEEGLITDPKQLQNMANAIGANLSGIKR